MGAAACAGGCAPELDTARVTADRGSLGREIFTMVCDRVGAQALREDVAGVSYHAVCPPDTQGAFEYRVDQVLLPALEAAVDEDGKPFAIEQQQKNREHRVARIAAVARRRSDLIAAFDAAFAHENV